MTDGIQEIGFETARQLIDFSGGDQSADKIWQEQLEGAVAAHNILAREKVAYLADEVGMGKTYVALGAVALFRHFNPGWRVLYIAPRENIQRKWHKEIRNFTAQNWCVTDNRVRSFQGMPAYSIAICNSLIDLARQVTVNPNRDFLLRMTSFSLPLPLADKKPEQWQNKRKELYEQIPWLDRKLFDLRQKDKFKDSYARALNVILPHFDLVVIDEGHNLKHGLKEGTAARNRLLAQVLGHPRFADSQFPHYSRRFDRVLILSATPLESDYRELWNQLDLFGYGETWKLLTGTGSDEITEADKQEQAGRFLIRRLGGLTIGGQKYTKNMYRREWRNGGVTVHDHPLPVADERQRLIVALVQKKVSEVLGHERFNNSFQIGMMASFESFLETAKVKADDADETNTFDGTDQTDEQLEKEGIDTPSINRLAQSYRQEFGESLPHPKMDAIAEDLRHCFRTGEKVLVFVRRVRSVDELAEKLNRHYDAWLKEYLLAQTLSYPTIQTELEQVFQCYETDRLRRRDQKAEAIAAKLDEETSLIYQDRADQGDNDTFFAWFFRGEGPKEFFSGASFNRNRLTSEGSAYSTFFEDNYITWLLGEQDDPVAAIAQQTGLSTSMAAQQLLEVAYAIFRQGSQQKRFPRLRVFLAYQAAALFFLEHARDTALADKARIIRRERFGGEPIVRHPLPGNFPEPGEYLRTQTFFTELAKRSSLRARLWPDEYPNDFTGQFRRREQRRELLSAAARLGHPVIDLWLRAALRLESISAGVQERTEDRAMALIQDYLDLLEQQQTAAEHGAFQELAKIADNFELILAVNFPSVRDEPLPQLSRLFGQALARQAPVGEMSGGINQSLVRQFRLPGYPLVLVTTDVLQEGEDLHTFCAKVVHYGISWTPSAMEQRTGRIDRIRSLTQRRLDRQPTAEDEQKLQVYYPHLRETVERLQVERVYERMNRFIRLMHRSFSGEQVKDSRVNTLQDFVLPPRDIEPITERLETIFPVKKKWLRLDLPVKPLAAKVESDKILAHFRQLTSDLAEVLEIQVEDRREPWSYFATVYITPDGQLALSGKRPAAARQQPFALYLRTVTGDGRVLLHCVGPVGVVGRNDEASIERINAEQQKLGFGKICAVRDTKLNTYNLTVEADILFHPNTTQPPEVLALIDRTVLCADHLEKALLEAIDQQMEHFRNDLFEEPQRA